LLVYSVVKVENDDDTTVFGRQCTSGQQNCDKREHKDIVTAWVSLSFNEAVSSLDSLSTISSIWQDAFSAIKAIAEKGILHKDISFRNIRIDDQHKLKVCDFDMAMFLDHQVSGVDDRTGTIDFMAVSILCSIPCEHRPIHDCESILWLCALDLLSRIGIGDVKGNLADIASPSNGIRSVRGAKSVILELRHFKNKTQRLKTLVSLDDPKDSSLFFCLARLMREFSENDCVNDYESAEEGIEDDCFDRCIGIIKRGLDPAVQVTEGIANTSLSP